MTAGIAARHQIMQVRNNKRISGYCNAKDNLKICTFQKN